MLHSSTTDTPGAPTQYRYADPKFNVKLRDYFAPFEFSAGFHTIGAEWTPSEVSIYIDGLKVATSTFQWKYADGSLAAPAHVLLNLGIGDGWAGRYGIDDSAFPQALAVDWVRVYQKK
jgi:beta-glucanase (GH16 family)